MEFVTENFFVILFSVVVIVLLYRSIANHKTIDQRMEETIFDPEIDLMANPRKRKEAKKTKDGTKVGEAD